MIEELLSQADIQVNGQRGWDITINDQKAFQRAFFGGIVGIGNSYVDGQWDCENIDELVDRVYRARLHDKVKQHWLWIMHGWLRSVTNVGSRRRAQQLANQHYNLGNDLFQAMLDPRLVYTCAYWPGAQSLAAAQEQKLDLVCRKLGLKPGMRLLDIGGGWGSLAKYAAEKYGVLVVNISVSKEQVELANRLCRGLPVENRLADYRDMNEPFDAVVSLGMFEHVVPKNYQAYMAVVDRCLKEGGLFLLHTIGGTATTNHGNPWIEKHIFSGVIPSLQQITAATEGRFVVEDVHNFGADYDKTLMAWWHNFDQHWPELRPAYGDQFYRMWQMYLQSSAGAFRARELQLWQIVFVKGRMRGGYQSVR